MELVSVDVETSNVFDLKPGEDLEKYAPFHVAVGATASSAGEPQVWMSRDSRGGPCTNMTRETARELLNHLRRLQQEGHRLCAWNGASFDLRWIGFAAEDLPTAREVALDLYDPMLQFFNRTGYPVGLDAVAQGMEPGLGKLLKSEDAPRLWSQGQHDKVIEYVCSDATITLKLVERIEQTHCIRWVTRKGDVRSEPMPRLLTVRQVSAEPEPDQSWMDSPIPRAKFVAWMGRA
ncbi:MAG: hypothetical protein KKI02_04155 [Planctomycetes bacterium]|nr:hypothetical protein [Planctomycetota bacterium]